MIFSKNEYYRFFFVNVSLKLKNVNYSLKKSFHPYRYCLIHQFDLKTLITT